jgi:hypothetical protein
MVITCLVSSSGVHFPFFPLAGSKEVTHRRRHCSFVRPGTIAAAVTQHSVPCFFTDSVSFASSS